MILKDWARYLRLMVSSEARVRFRARRRFKRERSRLEKLPRYTRTSTDLLGCPFEIVDPASLLWAYDEIFDQRIYAFRSRRPDPLILDCGANIGLSVLFFKRLYPASRLVAFEPDPQLFEVVQRNVQTLGLEDVELVPKAVWSSETDLSFFSEGADGGRVARSGDVPDRTIRTVRLRDYLDQPVDFLKLNIEGAETEVLRDSADLLSRVEHLYVEYHSFASEPQTLPELLGILQGAGFRMHLRAGPVTPQPFLARRNHLGIDLQLHVFAFRDPLATDGNGPGVDR